MSKQTLTPDQARQGRPGRPVLYVLIAAVILAIVAIGIVWTPFAGDDEGQTQAPAASSDEGSAPATTN